MGAAIAAAVEVYIRPCQSGRSLEAVPSPALDVDVTALEERLVEAGWQPLTNAGVLLIVRKEHEATVYATGKVVVKSRDGDAARRVWDEISPHLFVLDRRRR